MAQVDIDTDGDTGSATHSITVYEYNDSGIRVAQSHNGTKTLLLIGQLNPTGYAQILEEIAAASTTLLKSYLLGHDVLSQYEQATGLLHHLLTDGHGSTRQLVDAMGAPVSPGGNPQIYTYNAYGELLQFAGTPVTTMLYSGEQRDFNTQLDNLRARLYDPRTGRFNRLDDFAGNLEDPQSLHKYLYVHGDPINKVDPLGLFSVTELSSVGGIQNILLTGTNYIGTLVRAYNFASRFLQLLDYARIAIRFARALHLSTPQGAAAAVANELRELFGKDSINEISQACSEVATHIGPHWGKISRRIAERAPGMATEISLAVAPQLPGYIAAEAAGNLQFVLFTPTGPGRGRRRGDRLINVSGDFAIAVSPSGGRLFGFGVRPNRRAQGFDQWFRIDYWGVQ